MASSPCHGSHGSASERSGSPRAPHVRRRPDKTVLYELVREHAETLFAEARARSESGAGYPRYLEEEFRKYLRCGILGYGFARLVCKDCHAEELLAPRAFPR